MLIAAAALLLALSDKVVSGLPTDDCPLLGPTFPSSFDITTTQAYQNAVSSFPEVIERLFTTGAVNRTHSSFALDVYSTETGQPIYNYFHNAPGLNGTATKGTIDDETIFRIGSVSKLVTAYSILTKTGLGILDDPVTHYLPELGGNGDSDVLERIIWEDVTVGALASQQAGTGGFPAEFITCAIQNLPNCTEQNYLEFMRTRKRPVTPPHWTALYSDAGWGILGLVLSRITGMPYGDALQQVLGAPLNLNGTSVLAPSGEGLNAVVLPDPGDGTQSSWGLDLVHSTPSGGVYSNLADLRRIGSSILNNEFLSSSDTRSWMKPLAHTGSVTTSVGAPWEIYRLALPVSATSTRTRISDLYTKAGGNAGYGTVFALSPDHKIGFTVFVAGDGALAERWPLRDALGTAFITAAEHAGFENAAQNYAGTFVDQSSEGTNLTITVDADHPALGLSELYLDGVEVRQPAFFLSDLGLPAANVSVRLYPTGLESFGTAGYPREDTTRLSFRAFAQILPPAAMRSVVEGGTGLFDSACGEAWMNTDFIGTDAFVMEVVAGRLERVTSVFANRTLSRVE